MEASVLSPDRVHNVEPPSRDAADYEIVRRAIAFVSERWRAQPEIEAIKEAGASISISPFSELRIGFGMPQTGEFLAAGIPVGLSVDTVELTGNADMFGIMKLVQNVENGKAENEFKLAARRVLELGTIEGARSMGIADKVGSRSGSTSGDNSTPRKRNGKRR